MKPDSCFLCNSPIQRLTEDLTYISRNGINMPVCDTCTILLYEIRRKFRVSYGLIIGKTPEGLLIARDDISV